MTTSPAAKVLRFRWFIFLVLALAYFFVYFHRLSLSVVANDLVRDFHASASVMGLMGSIYFYCYAVMQFPAGLLSDSLGPRKTVTFFLLIAAAGSLLFGLAPTIKVAFVGRVLVGFGVSMVFIPTMKILSQWFRVREFAPMAGILNAVGGIGVMAATWLLALMTAKFGWRFSFEAIGVLTFFLVVLVWLLVRDRPEDRGWPSLAEIDHQGEGNAPPPARIGLLEGARRVVSDRYFWPVAIWFFFDCGIFFGFGALWGGPYLIHVYGMTRSEAGAILSMIAWGMIVGSPLLGYLSERVLHSRKKVLTGCMVVLSAVMIFLYLNPANLSRPYLYGVFFLFSLCSSAIVVIGFTTTKELFPVEIAGTSVGTVNLFPFLGGAVFMPVLGRVLDAYQKTAAGGYALEAYTKLLLVLCCASLIALFCTFLMKETCRR
ncbi:MAG: MFS transporter [Deltaproteobacteria bacterium]|nr:MFS transporter [Candidatus Anaeroferrophillus wilburensis]MBN2887909.1 MFS transporter [Deltaproteobacteria bacterium]